MRSHSGNMLRLLLMAIVSIGAGTAFVVPAAAQDGRGSASAPGDHGSDSAPKTPLSKAPAAERTAIRNLLGALAWPRRIIAVLRLQRFDCPESAAMVIDALHDRHVAVRSFALLVLAHRNVPQDEDWLTHEADPTVIRTALRVGYRVDPARLARGAAALSRSSRLDDKLLAAELGLLSDDEDLQELAIELIRTVILRMNKQEAGSLSPRLARLTGGDDLRRDYKWRLWYQKNRGLRSIDAARMLPPRSIATSAMNGAEATVVPTPSNPADLSEIARLPFAEFTALSDHLEALALQPLDLAIVLDCTASMSGEIAEAQGGVDDLMRFVGDVAGGIRVGIAGYRDRRELFEKVGWDLTGSIEQARANLWRLSAEGGGDRPELVDQGLSLAYTTFSWNPRNRGVLILVGDAPPHPGHGEGCIKLARFARQRGVTTHVVGCDPRIVDSEDTEDDPDEELVDADDGGAVSPFDVERGEDAISRPTKRRRWSRDRDAIEFFPEIAEAGGGRVVNLDRDERLVPEIAGLIVGVDFEEPMVEFFEVYMELCR
ncbi:MAG: VWA domain-containing protein [Phycisphaerales bacterium]|nr:VWA domain-containing protein [Phycisphaerales bacterium]